MSTGADGRVVIPAEPVRPVLDWSQAKLGICTQCGSRDDLVPLEGEKLCANCTDSNHLAEWKAYARALRDLIDHPKT